MHRNILFFTAFLSLSNFLFAEEWPAWRGPRGDGISSEKNLPLKWNKTDNIRWKTSIPGKGHSSPIVINDRIFLSTCLEDKHERRLLSIDRNSGKVLWDKPLLVSDLEKKHGENSFSSATPASDGKHLWISFMDFPAVRLFCYDLEGNKVWEQSPGKLLSRHGFCSSPVLHKDLVILNCDQDAEGYIVAYEKNSGKEKWRVDRPNKTRS